MSQKWIKIKFKIQKYLKFTKFYTILRRSSFRKMALDCFCFFNWSEMMVCRLSCQWFSMVFGSKKEKLFVFHWLLARHRHIHPQYVRWRGGLPRQQDLFIKEKRLEVLRPVRMVLFTLQLKTAILKLQGSMLWSQFSAICDHFRQKNGVFLPKPMLRSNFCII
jgi:hypothetical protein